MTRRTFFSFHYKPDVTRSNVVKKSQIVKDREDAGFLDSSAFEEAQKVDDDSLKRFLIKEMEGSSVVCALVGAETASRRWVRYEIQRGIWDARGLMAVRIHTIADFDKKTSTMGVNPFDVLGIYVSEKKAYLVERASTSEKWTYSSDFSKDLPKWVYGDKLPTDGVHALSEFFPIYSWSSTAHEKIGGWIESAATQAKRWLSSGC